MTLKPIDTNNMERKFVEVITNLPIDNTFQYEITGNERYTPEVGKRAHIIFRNLRRIGYIVKIENELKTAHPTALTDIIDEFPIFTPEMLELSKWIKMNYLCSWGEALEAMIPGALKRGKISMTSRIKEPLKDFTITSSMNPNCEQTVVLSQINECIDSSRHEVFLLHGVTGSGKTEIYLQVTENVISKGKTGIILVPEISLTPQTVERFMSRFGNKVAVIHSKMLESQKFNEWKRIKSGEARIVVGPRSAIFSPIENPGIFILDEEHEPSYKQEDSPRYNARDVAIERARISGAPVILGSATPSLESYHRAVSGIYKLVELTARIDDKRMPNVKLVDMRMELETRTGKRVVSKVMEEALKKDISKKQQALIFLNRRGFFTVVVCRKCGYVVNCLKCESPMVFHREKGELICHYCNRRSSPIKICPECSGEELMYKGTGTQKIEADIKNIIPEACVVRMDSDTMEKRGSHEKVLKDFKDHKIDVIVGTQMIAKGLDFPKVTLVGVIAADANLNMPDFRAGERTFNLITQVAGRAGRGDIGGEVIVQTFTPEHYAIYMAVKHNYHGFYLKEIEARRELMFPPFSHLAKITIRSKKEDHVIKTANNVSDLLRVCVEEKNILGPAPAPISVIRGFYRWNILVKGKDRLEIIEKLKKSLKGVRKPAGVFIVIDIDPMSM